MKFTVCFKPNTLCYYGERLVVNVPFLRSRSKSVAIRITRSLNMINIEKAELFVPNSLILEVPDFLWENSECYLLKLSV